MYFSQWTTKLQRFEFNFYSTDYGKRIQNRNKIREISVKKRNSSQFETKLRLSRFSWNCSIIETTTLTIIEINRKNIIIRTFSHTSCQYGPHISLINSQICSAVLVYSSHKEKPEVRTRYRHPMKWKYVKMSPWFWTFRNLLVREPP